MKSGEDTLFHGAPRGLNKVLSFGSEDLKKMQYAVSVSLSNFGQQDLFTPDSFIVKHQFHNSANQV